MDLLGHQAAQEAIQGLARSKGVAFRKKAAQAIVEDLCQTNVQQADGSIQTVYGPYVEPVQLQVACQRLWASRQQNRPDLQRWKVTAHG